MRGEQERRERIVELVRRDGFVSNDALARLFGVTPQTIRRDVAALCEGGRLRRWHGGAGLPSSVENLAYPARQVLCLAEKRRIAKLVAAHIPDEASLFINIGTTTEEVAHALLGRQGLRVITNNLNVAQTLAGKEDFQVIVAGGLVRAHDRGIVGEATLDLIRQFKVDFGIVGISGIDPDGTLLDFDYREVRIAQAIVQSSRRVFLATDHTKFGRSAMVKLGHITDADALFTDAPPPAPIARMMAEAGREVFVAPREEGSDV